MIQCGEDLQSKEAGRCHLLYNRDKEEVHDQGDQGDRSTPRMLVVVMIPFNENVVLLSTVKTRHCLITRYMAYYVAQIIIISCFIIE